MLLSTCAAPLLYVLTRLHKCELFVSRLLNMFLEIVDSKEREIWEAEQVLDDSYIIAQCLEHGWPQAKVPGSSPGGGSHFFFRLFPFASFPQTSEYGRRWR